MLQLDYTKRPQRSFNSFHTNLLCSWFILNCLKKNYPVIDPILAEIYFQTYGINTLGLSKEAFERLTTEYNDAILRFFLSCQRQRCIDIINTAKRCVMLGDDTPQVGTSLMIAVPSQCKPFFEEMLILDKELKTYNAFTKETQCLDSLRDTLVSNSISSRYLTSSRARWWAPGPGGYSNRTNTVGSMSYIVSQGEFNAYVNILYNAVIDLYRPLFNLDRDKKVKRPLYALNETYEDSGTKFSKIVDYIKTMLYILFVSYSEELLIHEPNIFWTCLPTSMNDAFTKILGRIREDYSVPYQTDIMQAVAIYGGLNINHAICLPSNTTVDLTDRFVFKKSNTSLTYQFLCCQEFITCANVVADERQLRAKAEDRPVS